MISIRSFIRGGSKPMVIMMGGDYDRHIIYLGCHGKLIIIIVDSITAHVKIQIIQ